jgi:hypothetical protein
VFVSAFYVLCVLPFPVRDLTFNVDGYRKKGKYGVKAVLKTAILGTAHILRKVLM